MEEFTNLYTIYRAQYSNTPLLHYSNSPLLQFSITPTLHYYDKQIYNELKN
jgi:hypothetical protein